MPATVSDKYCNRTTVIRPGEVLCCIAIFIVKHWRLLMGEGNKKQVSAIGSRKNLKSYVCLWIVCKFIYGDSDCLNLIVKLFHWMFPYYRHRPWRFCSKLWKTYIVTMLPDRVWWKKQQSGLQSVANMHYTLSYWIELSYRASQLFSLHGHALACWLMTPSRCLSKYYTFAINRTSVKPWDII